jgi:hypothetical protein
VNDERLDWYLVFVLVVCVIVLMVVSSGCSLTLLRYENHECRPAETEKCESV